MSIRFRLILNHICILFLISIGVYSFLNFSLSKLLSNRIDSQLRSQAQLIRVSLAYTLPEPEEYTYQEIDTVIDNLGDTKSAVDDLRSRLTFIDLEGNVWGDSTQNGERLLAMDNHIDRPEVVAALDEGAGYRQRFSDTLKEELRYCALPVERQGKVIGICRVAIDVKSIKLALVRVRNNILLAAVIGLVVAVVLSTISSQTIIQPLQKVSAAIDAVAQGNIDSRVDIPPGREGDFTHHFNQMGDQIRKQFVDLEQERRRTEVRGTWPPPNMQLHRLETILSSIAEGVLLIDNQYQIRYINLAAQRMLNLSEQSIGESLVEANRNPQLRQLFETAQLTQKHAVAELRLDPMEAKETQVTITPSAIGDEYLIFLFDVSQLRRLEKTRTDFVANVSHELRTPLTTIEGYAEILLDGALDDPDNSYRFTAKILEQSKQMALLITDLLNLSKLESGAISLRRVSCHLNEFYQPLIDIFDPVIEEASLKLKWQIADDLPLILVDRQMIRQVFVNFIDNAIKYTPKGGEITLSAAVAGNMVQCAVQDNGIGIPKESLPRIFERFYRVDKSRSRAASGTGLGLSICKHICLLHGSATWVESEVRHGATFFFTLPIYREELQQEVEWLRTDNPRSTRRESAG